MKPVELKFGRLTLSAYRWGLMVATEGYEDEDCKAYHQSTLSPEEVDELVACLKTERKGMSE